MRKTRLPLLLFVLPLFVSPIAVAAQDEPTSASPADQILRSLVEQMRAGLGQVTPLEVLTECNGGTISCGQTVTGRVYLDSCYASSSGVYAVGYLFNGSLGQRITLQAYSPSFRAGILLGDGREGNTVLYASNQATEVGGTAEIVNFALPYTGPYFIFVSPLVASTFGGYSLGVTCASSPPPGGSCTPSSTTLCLNNSRFRVTATFLTPQGQSGNATAVTETVDTGMFWFFSANNIEAIIKVVNGCTFNSRYWVFAGGLTNVQVVLTVVDTQNGTTRTYTNEQGTAFQPIQDTSAFATCP